MSFNAKNILAVLIAASITIGIIWNAKVFAFILFFFMLCFVIRWIMSDIKEENC